MPTRVLRQRAEDEAPRVTNMELFFDLVYVFAVTQLSDFLFEDLTLHRALEGLILFLAVWWAWNYTAWATNWLDPERGPTALLMVVLMVLGLVMSAALPEAFGSRGLPFAGAYVALQLVRSAFMVGAFPHGDTMRRNYAQLLAWSAIAGVPWIAGVFVHGDARLIVWGAAVVVDLGAPVHGFRLPGVPATPMDQWSLAGAHLAERCQLVLMIALGESVLRVGLTWSEDHASAAVDAAFIVGFLASVSLWAIYFLRTAERGAEAMAADVGGRIGRSGYAYAHAVMVGGVILEAVAIRAALSRPTADAGVATTAALLGGPALYIAGLVLFKASVGQGRRIPPIVAVAALAALAPIAVAGGDRLLLQACATAVLCALAVGAALDGRPDSREAGPFHRVRPGDQIRTRNRRNW